MKELEGKAVFLKPTGNNIRTYRERIQEAQIVKVNRTTVEVLHDGWSETLKYRFTGNHLDDRQNGGFDVYLTREELEDEYFVIDSAQKITEKFRYASDYAKLSRDKITQIASILGVEL